jgi:hypothetical protein
MSSSQNFLFSKEGDWAKNNEIGIYRQEIKQADKELPPHHTEGKMLMWKRSIR